MGGNDFRMYNRYSKKINELKFKYFHVLTDFVDLRETGKGGSVTFCSGTPHFSRCYFSFRISDLILSIILENGYRCETRWKSAVFVRLEMTAFRPSVLTRRSWCIILSISGCVRMIFESWGSNVLLPEGTKVDEPYEITRDVWVRRRWDRAEETSVVTCKIKYFIISLCCKHKLL